MSDNGNFSDVDLGVVDDLHDNHHHPYVSRLCAKLRANDPSVLLEEPSEQESLENC
jgi:hypothetical protein